mmetsp:Transcript_30187/g.86628  ORF Transcript_30187/g.86628 Transcript_30187/m.86628 type:complete len:201 (+) Transcript_30187:334-936(+)
MLAIRASLSAFSTSMDWTTCCTCCSYSFTTRCCSATCTDVIESSKLLAKSTFTISNRVATTPPCSHSVLLICSSILSLILSRLCQKSCGMNSCAVLPTMFPAQSRYFCFADSYVVMERYTPRSVDSRNWNWSAHEIVIGWPPLSGSLGSAPVRVATGMESEDSRDHSNVTWAAGNTTMAVSGLMKWRPPRTTLKSTFPDR